MSSVSRRLFSFSSRPPARLAERSARHVDAHTSVRFWFRRRSASTPKIRRPPSYGLRTTKPRGMRKNSGKFRADRFAARRSRLSCEHFRAFAVAVQLMGCRVSGGTPVPAVVISSAAGPLLRVCATPVICSRLPRSARHRQCILPTRRRNGFAATGCCGCTRKHSSSVTTPGSRASCRPRGARDAATGRTGQSPWRGTDSPREP